MIIVNYDLLPHQGKDLPLADRYQATLCATVWTALWEQIAPLAVDSFKSFLKAKGLFETIDLCNRWATVLLLSPEDFLLQASHELDGPVSSTLLYQIKLSVERTGDEFRDSADIVKKLLQLFRFAKRFTLNDADPADTISAFLENDNRIKMLDRRGIPEFIREGLSLIAASYMPKYVSKAYKPSEYWSYVPSGTTAEGASNSFEKYLLASAIGLVPEHMRLRASLNPELPFNEEGIWSRFTTVPKGYKTRRGICEERLATTLRCSHFAEYLTKGLDSKKGRFAPAGHVTLHDQNTNRELCREASYTGEMSTIDLSSASDSISASIASAILPVAAGNDFFVLRSNTVLVDRGTSMQERTLHLACTMGSRMTFPLECHVFWCFVCLAVKLHVDLADGSYADLNACGVYGDDIVIPTKYAETLVDLLNLCGFKVNAEKSFTTTTGFIYRESCGVEYLNGFDVSSIFWPRKPLKEGQWVPLVALHNSLYDAGYTCAASVLHDVVVDQVAVPDVFPESNDFGLHGNPTVVTGEDTKCAVIAHILDWSVDSDGTYYEKERKLLVPLPAPDLSCPLFVVRVRCPKPVYDNRKLSHSKSLFSVATEAIIKDLYEEFCMIRSIGCPQMSYDKLCETVGVVQPRNFRKALHLTDKVRFVDYDVLTCE